MAEILFRDIPLSFIAHPVTGNINYVTDAAAVKQSVRSLVLTNFYERPYRPTLGGDVIRQLFDNFGPITQYNIATNIRQVLENYEPRAVVDNIRVNQRLHAHQIDVTIVFHVINTTTPLTVSILLERIR